MKNEAQGLTSRSGFGNIPRINRDLFEVRAGTAVDEVTSIAACLAESIASVATQAVANDGMDVGTAYLVRFAAEALQAMMCSVESAFACAEVQS